MSRSIHTTNRDYEKVLNAKYADKAVHEEVLCKIEKQLIKKQKIKQQKRKGRELKKDILLSMPVDVAALPINYQDENEWVHYPVQKNDILDIAKYLPAGVFDGLDSITFCLGKEFIDEDKKSEEDVQRDPYVNRIGSEITHGVYSGSILGLYFSDKSKIYIFAYVYAEKSLKPRDIFPYLRLQMMSTLIHEIAHHDDYMRRMGRGRWLGMNKAKVEDYAELMQAEWAKSAVIPYLLDSYPEEYEKLSGWIIKYGGVDFPLHLLAGESGGYEVDGLYKISITASSALEDLFQDIADGKSLDEARIDFAEGLHFAEYYKECLGSLDSILSIDETNEKALGMKADTLLHLGKCDEAESLALKCLSINPNNCDALDVTCEIYEDKKDWNSLLKFAERGINVPNISKWSYYTFTMRCAVAAIFLEKLPVAEKILNSVAGQSVDHWGLALKSLLAYFYRDYEKALKLSSQGLLQEKIIFSCKAVLKAVQNAAMDRMKMSKKEKAILSGIELNYLKNRHLDELFLNDGDCDSL
jgi:tetratricopeptide (TPR) repeat protein